MAANTGTVSPQEDLAPEPTSASEASSLTDTESDAGLLVDGSLALTTTPPPTPSPQDSIDFVLHPVEMAKGRRAAENYLSSFKSEENRLLAEEALETLATVISGGKCASLDFPWQQVRPYHGAAALTILKEKGAPARIEALRCRWDSTRSYRVVPECFPPRQVQKIRSTLSKVIEECSELGFLSEEESASPPMPARSSARTRRPSASARNAGKTRSRSQTSTSRAAGSRAAGKGRLLGNGELRALVATCAAEDTVEGSRDAVLFSLVYRGLKIAEITSLTLESIRFSNKTGVCQILARPSRGTARGRRVALTNDELICLEDWLEHRGDHDGPLLCTIGRGGKIEGKRLTVALLKSICEQRGAQAEVQPFVPNDLSKSADALTEHRKAARKRSSRKANESSTKADRVLFDGDDDPASHGGETIRFPFLGLVL